MIFWSHLTTLLNNCIFDIPGVGAGEVSGPIQLTAGTLYDINQFF